MTVYTSPDQPGAPQPGDIVVVIDDGPPFVTQLIRCRKHTRQPWCVEVGGVGGGFALPTAVIRWPTTEELAVYQLVKGVP